MKKNKLFFITVLLCLFIIKNNISAQVTGDFQSQATGNWSAVGTWQTYDGTTWQNATALPDLTQGISITIQTGHTVTVDVALTANNAALKIIVNGYLKETGVITKTAGIWTINGTYEFNHISASGSGLPTATWNDGSTCSFTGITSSTTGINASQSFYNIVFNCPSMSSSLNLGWNTGTISVRGNFTINNTGSGRLQVCGPVAGTSGAFTTVTVNIGGNLVVDGSNATSTSTGVILTSNGTSNNYTAIVINVAGNVTVTGNSAANNAYTVFAISKGSQGGTGTTIWNFSGDVNVTNAALQNSNTAGGKFVFAKSGTQVLNLSGINSTAAPINMEVLSGSTLNLGNNTLSPSSGFFQLDAGAGIMTSLASGLDGNLTNTGTKTLNTSANYIFNGSTAQVTGALMPATVNNLTNNNPAGLTLSTSTTVSGTLRTSSTLTNNNTLTINGSFQIDEGGWATGNNFVYGAAGTLVFNNSSSPYGVGSGAAYWPGTSGPVNVTVQNTGGLLLQTSQTVSGIFQTSTSVANTFGNNLTVSGTVKLNSGGYFGNFSPTFTNSGTLVYNTGGTYGVNNEWGAGSTAGYGVPQNVSILNGTAVSLSGTRTVPGTLTLTSGKLRLGANNLTIGGIGASSSTNYIVTDGAGTLTQSVPFGTTVIFPIGASASSYDQVSVNPLSATNISARVSATLTGTAPTHYTYNAKEWNLNSSTPSSTVVGLTPSANGTGVYPNIGLYNGSAYVNTPATVTGSTFSATFSSFGAFVTGYGDLSTGINQATIAGVTFDGQTIHNNANADLQVFDATGRLMVSSNKNINMSVYSKGVYLVKSNSATLKIAN